MGGIAPRTGAAERVPRATTNTQSKTGAITVLAILLLWIVATGESHNGASRSSSAGTVHVRTYTRKDGTVVREHCRRRPAYPVSPSDSRGRIKRSTAAKNAFQREHPCPSNGKTKGGCPGYVIDHISPLECGGRDDPSNMQWQTIAEGKAKDKVERHCH